MSDYASKITIDGQEILLKGIPAPIVSRGVDGLCPALPNGSGTSKYLREDGTWVVPPNTTYSVVTKGSNGLCPALPNESTTTKYLRQDGSWVVPPNTTYNTFTRSSSGLVPTAPSGSGTTKYLREDGTWSVPPNTTYNVVAKGSNGLCPALPNESTTTKYLRQDGSWVVPPNTTTGTSYNAGSCPDNTTFGTNGSIARVYTALNNKIERGSVSITTTSTETWRNALNRLFAQIDFSKLTPHTMLKDNNNYYHIVQYSSGVYDFSMVGYINKLSSLRLMSSASESNYIAFSGDGTTFNYGSNTTSAVGSAKTLQVIY